VFYRLAGHQADRQEEHSCHLAERLVADFQDSVEVRPGNPLVDLHHKVAGAELKLAQQLREQLLAGGTLCGLVVARE
jgi:hypothetical protein